MNATAQEPPISRPQQPGKSKNQTSTQSTDIKVTEHLKEEPHIAMQVDVRYLGVQKIGEEEKHLIGVILAAAPCFFEGSDVSPPLLTRSETSSPLDPYLPWKWKWGDSGFTWKLFKKNDDKWEPSNSSKIYGAPGGYDEDAGKITEWWTKELESALLCGDEGGWISGPYSPSNPAHARRIQQTFYPKEDKPADSIDIGKDDLEDTHPDLLGSRLMHWATSLPPYNYVNRLAAVFEVSKDWLDSTDQFVAFPVWGNDDQTANIKMKDRLPRFAFLEQDKIPIDGKENQAAFLRISYANIATVPESETNPIDLPRHLRIAATPAPSASMGEVGTAAVEPKYTLHVEPEPWRVDLESRLGPCLDVAILVLEWAESVMAEEKPSEQLVELFSQPDFAKWMAGLSADLFQAREAFAEAAIPKSAEEWIGKLKVALEFKEIKDGLAEGLVLDLTSRCLQVEELMKTNSAEVRTVAERLQIFRQFFIALRDNSLFPRLRNLFEKVTKNDGTEVPPIIDPDKHPERTDHLTEDRRPENHGKDWIADARAKLVRLPRKKDNMSETLGAKIIPILRSENPALEITGLADELVSYIETRRNAASSVCPPIPSTIEIQPDFFCFVHVTKAKLFRTQIFGDMSRPIEKPHGFTLVAGKAERYSTSDTDDEDQLDVDAGALVFARVAAFEDLETTAWMSLNAGNIHYQEDEKSQFTGCVTLHVPIRPGWINDRLGMRLDYDNRPLVAKSKKDALVIQKHARPNPQDGAVRFAHAFKGFLCLSESRIPALRYHGKGKLYQFMWVTLSNSCVLPEGFWRDHPAVLNVGSIPKDANTLTSLPGVKVSSPDHYYRRTGIGLPIVSVDDAKSHWPELPDGIEPLSNEIPGSVPDERRPLGKPGPLIVLFPEKGDPKKGGGKILKEITLLIGKPKTSDEDWERWVSADGSATPDQRRAVCAAAHWERDKQFALIGEKGKEGDEDTPGKLRWQPDDPALSDTFVIVFRCRYPHPIETKAIAFCAKWEADTEKKFPEKEPPKPDIQIPVGNFYKKHRDLKFISESTDDDSFVRQNGEAFIVAPGHVVEVSICPVLPAEKRERFSKELKFEGSKTWQKLTEEAELSKSCVDFNDGDLLLAPFVFRIETAVSHMPTADEIYKALRPSYSGDSVTVAVKGDRDSLFDWAHGVTVQQQLWNWSGKPMLREEGQDLPKVCDRTKAEAGKEQGAAWDGIGFAHRSFDEHLPVETSLPIKNEKKDPDGKSVYQDTIIHRVEKKYDLRSHYYRFSVKMRSRYFGVWDKIATWNDKPREVQAEILQEKEAKNADGDKPKERWKRVVLPVRLTEPMKRPAVKLVIPLLSSESDDKDKPTDGGTAGLLVVVREPWYEQAGIAERMECELVNVKHGAKEGMEHFGEQYFQAGYDPILSAAALNSCGDGIKSFITTSSPFGLTFDQGGRDPLIVNSVFRLDVARGELGKLIGSGTAPASHLFCKLSFRRKVAEGYLDKNGTTASDALASEWTESEWVQFTPDADLIRPSSGDEWEVQKSGEKLTLQGWKQPVHGVARQRVNAFSYLFCVTRRELDASGRPVTLFHALYAIKQADGETLTRLLPSKEPPGAENLYAHVLEVLVRSSSKGAENAKTISVEDLFPETAPEASVCEDAVGIATAMSRAYPVKIENSEMQH